MQKSLPDSTREIFEKLIILHGKIFVALGESHPYALNPGTWIRRFI